ncbi:MAG: hypothetical protein KGL57_03105 [Burkholderiales bacterium]|nr:hypothetical protein [Burkholderiales bacterium]
MSALGLDAWVLVACALIWGGFGALWLQRDVQFVISQSANHSPANKGDEVDTVWAEWITGWYWRTDAAHRLVVLKPGLGLDQDSTNWTGATQLMAQQPIWFDCWPSSPDSEPALGRLRFAMTHQQVLADSVRLVLPKTLSLQDAQWCEIKAQPRWDSEGQFVGFHGVIDPARQPVVAPAVVEAASTPEPVEDHGCGDGVVPTPMTESDQEVLRYALSHDLRAPLRVVDGFTRIVKEDYSKVLDRIGVDHLDRVLAAAARMNGMIDAILAQAQLAGAPLRRDVIDLTALARDISLEMGHLPGACLAARFEIAEGMTVEADTILVRRVLENLISNALKYSAKVEAPLIEVGVMPATNPAVFFVRDNGAGFDMQRADKLFGLFQRMHSAKDFPGTGVGLAGVHNIIRRHGGQVWAEASPGKGACFYFTLMGTAEAQQRAASRA